MNYTDARKYIKSLSGRGITPGLESVSALCEALGNPQDGFKSIHIAGTNGKGSTGAFIESILRAGNKNVCRFVSPAVGDYLESFTYNGEPVAEELYAECVSMIADLSDIAVSAFEAETAVAFLIFKKLAPDYAIIECGMGGLLDSTNIITPEVSVITSISLDHTAFLGDTLAEIATQKCGIIKNHGKAVTSVSQSDEIRNIIETVCKKNNASLYYAEAPCDIKYWDTKTEFMFEKKTYEIPLLGAYQPSNAVLAVKTAQTLGIDEASIKTGLKTAVWRYRFERVGKFILDGAHNADAALQLAKSVEITLKNKRIAYICGCFRDKDYNAIARITAPFADEVFCITPPTERGLDASVLCAAFKACGANAHAENSLADAIGKASEFDAVVIFGSLSFLGEARKPTEGINSNGKM